MSGRLNWLRTRLPTRAPDVILAAMSTLAEIEAAVDKLPTAEQKSLLRFIAERVHRSESPAVDPVAALIGTYHSGTASTGEDAEDILYGNSERA